MVISYNTVHLVALILINPRGYLHRKLQAIYCAQRQNKWKILPYHYQRG
jgi:hypothetical protein